jgi:transposase
MSDIDIMGLCVNGGIGMPRRYALRDEQWNRMQAMLPGSEDHVGVTARDNRLFVEAVWYRYRAGIPWRDLPERFGDWKNVHRCHSRWAASGVWERVFKALSADTDNEYAMIDSTIVRAHQHSAGARKKRAHKPSGGAKAGCPRRFMPPATPWAIPQALHSRPGRRMT